MARLSHPVALRLLFLPCVLIVCSFDPLDLLSFFRYIFFRHRSIRGYTAASCLLRATVSARSPSKPVAGPHSIL